MNFLSPTTASLVTRCGSTASATKSDEYGEKPSPGARNWACRGNDSPSWKSNSHYRQRLQCTPYFGAQRNRDLTSRMRETRTYGSVREAWCKCCGRSSRGHRPRGPTAPRQAPIMNARLYPAICGGGEAQVLWTNLKRVQTARSDDPEERFQHERPPLPGGAGATRSGSVGGPVCHSMPWSMRAGATAGTPEGKPRCWRIFLATGPSSITASVRARSGVETSRWTRTSSRAGSSPARMHYGEPSPPRTAALEVPRPETCDTS